MSELIENVDFSEEDPWTPPTPRRVAARALVMSAVACRGFIEKAAGNAEAEDLRLRVADWVASVGVSSEAEPHELAMLNAPLGTLSSKQAMDAGWLCEGLAMLAWALQRFPLPEYDKEVDPYAVAEGLDFLWDDARDLLDKPELRPGTEIQNLEDQVLALHWRVADFKKRPRWFDFKAFVEWNRVGPAQMGIRFVEDDLAIGDLPILRAAEEDVDRVNSLARTRHQALDWLLGQDALYSQVTPDT